jgi:hypothetical protein
LSFNQHCLENNFTIGNTFSYNYYFKIMESQKIDFCDERENNLLVSEKEVKHSKDDWKCLYSAPLSFNLLKDDYQQEYVRILEIVRNENKKIFIDIRSYKNCSIPTRYGVTLYVSEFHWLISRFFKNKPGVKQQGKRIILVTKEKNFSMKIKVKSSSKKTLYLNYGEIKCLKRLYDEVKNKLKEESILQRSEAQSN